MDFGAPVYLLQGCAMMCGSPGDQCPASGKFLPVQQGDIG